MRSGFSVESCGLRESIYVTVVYIYTAKARALRLVAIRGAIARRFGAFLACFGTTTLEVPSGRCDRPRTRKYRALRRF